jgi:hypothetical protein
MTHPLAGYNEEGRISPYMMALLGNQRALDFADSVIHAQKKRVLDELGIDDNSVNRRRQQHENMEIVTRFYPCDIQCQPKKIELSGQPFIEQEPTKPYFVGQKVVTPDFTLFRAAQEKQRKNLLLCKTRDDSSLFSTKHPSPN